MSNGPVTRAHSIAALVLVLGFALAGCGGNSGITDTATTAEASTTAQSSTPSTTTDTGPVKGTTFDACAAITDANLTAWQVDPASRRDAQQVPWGKNARGCVWDGPQWGIKVYTVDGKLSNWDTPDEFNDRQEPVTVGSRSGWLLHTKNGLSCTVVLPSQQALFAAQVDLFSTLTKQRYDQCPLAVQIATQIEPKIPQQ